MSSVGDKEVVSLGDALEDRLLYGRGGDALDLAMMIDSLIKTRIAEALQPASTPETGTAPDNSGVCPVCGWPTGHCNVGCTATSHQRIKIGDRVRLAIGTNTMLPTDGWTVYKLPSPEWRSYGVKHDNGGDMSINAEYVVPV